MSTWLKRLSIHRVALVDRGANPDAHIALYKRHSGEPMPEIQVPEEVQKRLTDLEKKLSEESEARKRAETDAADAKTKAGEQANEIAKIRTEQRVERFIAKAKDLPAFGKADEFGPMLADIDAALGDRFAKFEQSLRAIHKQLETSRLLTSLGVDGADENASPEAKLDGMAKQYLKETKGVTYEQAYSAVCQSAEGAELLAASLKGGK